MGLLVPGLGCIGLSCTHLGGQTPLSWLNALFLQFGTIVPSVALFATIKAVAPHPVYLISRIHYGHVVPFII